MLASSASIPVNVFGLRFRRCTGCFIGCLLSVHDEEESPTEYDADDVDDSDFVDCFVDLCFVVGGV